MPLKAPYSHREMMNKAHGEMEIVLEGNIVHTYPQGAFNGEGIKKFRQKILEKAPRNKPWILFEHPMNEAEITPEALIELEKTFLACEENGCFAIVQESSLVYGIVVQIYALGLLNIPSMVSKDRDELLRFIQRKEQQCLSQLPV